MGISAIGAAIGGVGSLIGGGLQASAAGDAAQAQLQAAQLAAETQLQMYNQTRADLAPWMTTGGAANTQLANLYGLGPGGTGVPNTAAMTTALENTPGYQFTLNQGQQALDRSAASRGLLLSGAQLKDSQSYGQGLAMSNAWAPYINELNTMSTAGQDSAAKVGQIGQQYGSNIGSAQLAAGSASAMGSILGANALSSGIGGMMSSFGNIAANGGFNFLGGGGGGGGYDPFAPGINQ